MAVKPIPEGYRTVTPYLIVDGAAKCLEFVGQAFGAEERFRMDGPGGSIGHAEVTIGDSVVMMADTPGEGEPTPGNIHLYVEDCDATYRRALDAGGESLREPTDQFYGDRTAGVRDATGNQWWLSTHVEDVAHEEIVRRAKEMS